MLTGNAWPLTDSMVLAIGLTGVAGQFLVASRLGRHETWTPARVRVAVLAAGLAAGLVAFVALYAVTGRPLSKEEADPFHFLVSTAPLVVLFCMAAAVPLVTLSHLVDRMTGSWLRPALLGIAGVMSVAWPSLVTEVGVRLLLVLGLLGCCAALLGRKAYRFQQPENDVMPADS